MIHHSVGPKMDLISCKHAGVLKHNLISIRYGSKSYELMHEGMHGHIHLHC